MITGGPGVGKTTIVKAIVHLARLVHRRVALAAPTGRAAKRLGEATVMEAMTIHRLLEFQPHEGGFQRGPSNPLDADLLVIDEASMVDAQLFSAVVGALRAGRAAGAGRRHRPAAVGRRRRGAVRRDRLRRPRR